MAEGILLDKIKSNDLKITVDSAGTSNYHIGEAPDKRMQQKAIEHGLDISHQLGRQFVVEDFIEFDHIFAMDESNRDGILRKAINNEDNNKVELFLENYHPDDNLNVPDPYYGRTQGFEEVYQMLNIACDNFIKSFKNE